MECQVSLFTARRPRAKQHLRLLLWIYIALQSALLWRLLERHYFNNEIMKRFVLFFCLMAITVGAVAEDRLVVTRVAGMSAPGEGTNDTPVPHTIAGLKFKALQRNAEEVVRQLGDKTVWWDVGPDASYASIEIYLGGKRHVINSWYPLFRTNVKVAVSETQGLVPVSGLAEKRKIENGNSAKYRSIVGLFDKVEIALKD